MYMKILHGGYTQRRIKGYPRRTLGIVAQFAGGRVSGCVNLTKVDTVMITADRYVAILCL
jgi:hypothetical protein